VLYTYEPLARFQDLFHMGSAYNCVTSTSLFAVVCTNLKIPVTLYVTPNHVFAAVTNNKDKVLRVEMTDPKKGFDFKTGIKESIKYLKAYKLVSEAEFKQKGERQVYLEFVNQARKISVPHLLAITYYNQAYGHGLQKRYGMGIRTAAKCLLIDQDDAEFKNLLKGMVGQYFGAYDLSQKPLASLREASTTAIRFLKDDPDFLKKVVDSSVFQVYDVHKDKAPREEVLAYLEDLILQLNDFEPIKRNVMRLHQDLIRE